MIVTRRPASAAQRSIRSAVGSSVVGSVAITPMRVAVATARSAIGRSTRSTGTSTSSAAVSTARPIDEQVTMIVSAPAASAAATCSTTRRAVAGRRRPWAITSLMRLSSTRLKTATWGSCSRQSCSNIGTSVADVWISPSRGCVAGVGMDGFLWFITRAAHRRPAVARSRATAARITSPLITCCQ